MSGGSGGERERADAADGGDAAGEATPEPVVVPAEASPDETLALFEAEPADAPAAPTPAAAGATPEATPVEPGGAGGAGGEGGPGPGGERWVGKRLGKFRLLRTLGEGTAGVVFQAEDTHLRRIIALKVLRRPGGTPDRDARVEQFLREARAAARLEHPNVARIHEIDHHDGWWYIATEFLEGGSVRGLVRAAGPLPPERACPVLADAAAALHAAHAQGMIHRDVKPANLMLTRACRAKLVDFGLVRLDDPQDPAEADGVATQAAGTPHYLAPELAPKLAPGLARREPPTPAADVYSLGATLHYVLTGEPPFKGTSVREVLAAHAEAPRPDLRAAAPACSEALAQLFGRMLAVDPAERPAMDEVAALLRVETIGLDAADTEMMLVLPGEGTGPLPPVGAAGPRFSAAAAPPVARGPLAEARSAWWQPGNRVRRRVAAGVLVALLAGLSVWAWRGTELHPGDAPVLGRAAFAHRFPAAPAGYGQRAPADRLDPAAALAPAAPPPFSWRASGDAPGAWVGHRAGRRFYGRDDPRGWPIPADAAVFFDSADAARRAGRTAADR